MLGMSKIYVTTFRFSGLICFCVDFLPVTEYNPDMVSYNTAPDPVAFELFGIDIRWYGILMALGILAGGLVFYMRAPRHGISRESVLDILIVAIPFGIVFSRLYYVIFTWENYSGDLWQILNFRGGGLSVHGSLIGGILGAYIVARVKKIDFPEGLDAVVPGFAIAQAIARWGNFFNSEAHGGPTDLPFGIMVMGEKVHPTFLYESIWCLLLFFFLLWVDNRRKFKGQTALLYGMLYSAERFFVEALRTDSLMIGPFRQAQVLSLLLIVVCGILYIFLTKKQKRS